MRSMKKLLVLVMAMLMLVSLVSITAFAADDVDYTEAAKKLSVIGIMKGDTSGNLMLDSGVTRYQAALFFVQALTGETTVEKWNEDKQSAVFTDVPEYGTAIDYANGIGLIKGRGDGSYGYNDPITYQDMLVLAVRALGYETEGMSYPHGYLTAAKKLKLTENLAVGIANTQPLTRGETAQIIWDMLGIEIAAKDPVSNKILYPGELSVGTSILGGTGVIPRTTLLVEGGFTQATLEGEIVKYNEAKTSKDITTVTIEYDGGKIEVAASDLGITARTNKSTFLGLPVTLHVDSETVADFEKDYDIVAEESEAKIIFADMLTFTEVKNVGDEGNIKVVVANGDTKVTLGDNTFAQSKYTFDLRVLGEDGWESADFSALSNAFIYDSDDEEYTGTNSYGAVSYAIVTEKVGGKDVSTVIMLYTPYTFGQYFTRTIRYQPLVSDESFITIGTYDKGALINNDVKTDDYLNFDGDPSYFVERLLGYNDTIINSDTTSVSKTEGEAARDAKISGGSVRSGDFIFYYYNELDNVLVIGQNCGGIKSGNLTSQSPSAKTVKLAGTTYTYGFAGAYTSNLPTFEDLDIGNQFLANIEAGQNNANYVVVDDRAIYVEAPQILNKRSRHNYIITTTDPKVMAELLDLEYTETAGRMDADCEYAKALTDDGIYVSKNGNMTIAVLNTANGKWGLGEVSSYECGESNGKLSANSVSGFEYEDMSFPYTVNVAEGIENYNIFEDSFKGYSDYKAVIDNLKKGGMFAVRENKSGVYKLCPMFSTGDWGMIDNGMVVDGLFFSDTANKTNPVIATRSSSAKAARVTINANTVIVVIDKDRSVDVRVGLQGPENSIVFDSTSTSSNPGGFLYSANSNLIVLRLNTSSSIKAWMADEDGEATTTAFDVAKWADGAAVSAEETYYVGLNGAAVSYDRLDDGTYEITVSGLFNLRTMRSVAAIKLSVDDLDKTDIEDVDLAGKVLYMDNKGILNTVTKNIADALTEAVNMRFNYSSTSADRYHKMNAAIEFVDDSSISATIGTDTLNKKDAVSKINVSVATVDTTSINWDKYDIDSLGYKVAYNDDNQWSVGSIKFTDDSGDTVKYHEYDIAELNSTENITSPAAGIFDQYIIDVARDNTNNILVQKADSDAVADALEVTVRFYACGQFDEDDGIVNLYVIKVVAPVATAD